MSAKKILIVNYESLTDALMLTASIRDLQTFSFGSYQIDVHTLGMAIWEHNPHIARLDWRAVPYDGESELAANEYGFPEHKTKIICYDPEIQVVNCSKRGYFPASERFKDINAYHRLHTFAQDLAERVGLTSYIPLGEMKGVVTISDIERTWMSQIEEAGDFSNFWIVSTGGPAEQSSSWWDPGRYQHIVDEFRGKVTFVQVGLGDEHHPRLDGVIDLVGKTDLRQLIRLMYHAGGYVGAPGFLSHLAAAVPSKPTERNGRARAPMRAAVLISGGREPHQWYAYEGQQVLHTNGMLSCCEVGGCGKSRCETPHRLEPHPEQLCSIPVRIGRDGILPKCLDMITPSMVIERINLFFDGGAYFFENEPYASRLPFGEVSPTLARDKDLPLSKGKH
jgi:hypothetical protein